MLLKKKYIMWIYSGSGGFSVTETKLLNKQ